MADNKWHQKYRADRKAGRLLQLGGSCNICGNKKDLQFDHINPKLKQFSIGSKWWKSKKEIQKELLKCQLLCIECHKEKTRAEAIKIYQHGTVGMYWSRVFKCRCSPCKDAWNKYKRQNRKEER